MYQSSNEKNDASDHFPKECVISDFPLALSFFEKTLEENVKHLEYLLPSQPIIKRRFF